MNKLSIVIPIFNEEKNIIKLFKKLKKINLNNIGFKKEIIAIDDGSIDKSLSILKKISGIKVLKQNNYGKGKAVQYGIKKSSGNYVIIQDGDLEYDPKDIIRMCKLLKNENKISIYGSRYLPLNLNIFPKFYRNQNFSSYIANIFFIFLFFIMYGKIITDPLTGYKLYEKKFFLKNKIKSNGFEADHEISAKLIKQKYAIKEVPITYKPRTAEEGKKINFFDAIKAIVTITKFRFFN